MCVNVKPEKDLRFSLWKSLLNFFLCYRDILGWLSDIKTKAKAGKMKLSILILILITSTLQKGCLSAPEPLCSKFSYDEQLLEKMIRMEFNVNNMEKSMHAAEKKFLETQKNMEDTLENIENKIKLLEEKEAAFIDKVNNTVRSKCYYFFKLFSF